MNAEQMRNAMSAEQREAVEGVANVVSRTADFLGLMRGFVDFMVDAVEDGPFGEESSIGFYVLVSSVCLKAEQDLQALEPSVFEGGTIYEFSSLTKARGVFAFLGDAFNALGEPRPSGSPVLAWCGGSHLHLLSAAADEAQSCAADLRTCLREREIIQEAFDTRTESRED